MHNLYIGLDRDGTIELPDVPPPAELVEQLHDFQRAGAKVFLASGKSYEVLRPICAELGLQPWMYCCENGGHVVFPATGAEYVTSTSGDLSLFLAQLDSIALPPYKEEAKQSIWSKKFGEHSLAAKAILDEFVAKHGLALDVFAYPDGDGGLDVVPRGIDKVNLLKFLPPQAVVHYFGDGENDLGIMRAPSVTPHTVANAKPVVKQCVAEKSGYISDLPAGLGVTETLKRLKHDLLAMAA